MLEKILEYYIAHPQEREAIDFLFRSNVYFSGFLTSFPSVIAKRLVDGTQENILLALLAAEIAFRFNDFRDMYIILGELYLAAVKSNINFEDEIENLEKQLYRSSLAILRPKARSLREFLRSAHLKDARASM